MPEQRGMATGEKAQRIPPSQDRRSNIGGLRFADPPYGPEKCSMSRTLRAAVAQLGPIHLADSREAVVRRLCALLREAHGGGAKFVVFPELALTTFFPRYWMTDQAEID